MASARIIVEPKSALVDPAVSIRLDGFPSREHVSLRARARDDLGRMWESLATYVTDENGVVDLSIVRPESGTFQNADPMGLLWSMSLKGDETTWFVKNTLVPRIGISYGRGQRQNREERNHVETIPGHRHTNRISLGGRS